LLNRNKHIGEGFCVSWKFAFPSIALLTPCGGLEMAPHENKWSPLYGAHEQQVTEIVTTSELS